MNGGKPEGDEVAVDEILRQLEQEAPMWSGLNVGPVIKPLPGTSESISSLCSIMQADWPCQGHFYPDALVAKGSFSHFCRPEQGLSSPHDGSHLVTEVGKDRILRAWFTTHSSHLLALSRVCGVPLKHKAAVLLLLPLDSPVGFVLSLW
jgi:hypothetical protein